MKMMLAGLILAAAAPAPLSRHAEVSPAVVAIAGPHGLDLPPEALKRLEALDEAGDRTASALLAEFYTFTNKPGLRDPKRGCDYAERAGAHASARHNLATCYFLGNGRPLDLARARALYAEAADLGFAKAACALGNMLIAGQGGEKDVARGLDLCRQAADAGEPDAQTDYGIYLLMGEHMPKDAARARHYLALAAAKRHANASYLLGLIYWNGDGVEKDREEAARWLQIAYEGGRADAALPIGMALFARILDDSRANRRVPVSLVQDAEKWFGIAAEKDPDPAKRAEAKQWLKELTEMQLPRV